MNRPLVMAACAAVALTASPAGAQVIGAYVGQSRDGQPVQFNVDQQPGTTALWVHDATVFIHAACEQSRQTVTWGEAYGVGAVIAGRKAASDISISPYFNIRFDLTFSRDGKSAVGTIRSIIPALDSGQVPARRALFCVSRAQSLRVTLSGGAAKKPRP